jgi:hypothetical protein
MKTINSTQNPTQLKITCEYCGGLGNQLFQIYTTIAHAIEWKAVFYFLDSDISPSITYRKTYWKTFLSSFRIFLKGAQEIKLMEEKQLCLNIKEKEFAYNQIVYPNIESIKSYTKASDIVIKLGGYFQSYLYFEKHFETINRMIRLEEQKNQVIEKYNTLASQSFSREMPYKISMHFRLGDYVKLQHTHPITPFEYYYTCMMYIIMNEFSVSDAEPKKFYIYYFCEDEWKEYVDTNYIKRLIENFGNSNNGFELCFIPVTSQSSSLDDWEQMLLMSCCDINIIANSTFSLWGAYFNSKFIENNKQDSSNISTYVYYPTKWFQDSVGHDVKNLFKSEKEGWKGIDIIL